MKEFSHAYDACCFVPALHKRNKQGVFFFPRLFCCSLLYSDFLLFLKCQGRCTENLFLPFQLLMQDLG